jgi:hypothetical protein
MASSDRKSKLAELQAEYMKETASATREMNERLSKIEEKMSPGYTGSGV